MPAGRSIARLYESEEIGIDKPKVGGGGGGGRVVWPVVLSAFYVFLRETSQMRQDLSKLMGMLPEPGGRRQEECGSLWQIADPSSRANQALFSGGSVKVALSCKKDMQDVSTRMYISKNVLLLKFFHKVKFDLTQWNWG
jgi:hypothetical protein